MIAERVSFVSWKASPVERASRTTRYEAKPTARRVWSCSVGAPGRSVFDLSVSGRPPTSSEAAGPLEKNKTTPVFSRYTAAFYVVGGPGAPQAKILWWDHPQNHFFYTFG